MLSWDVQYIKRENVPLPIRLDLVSTMYSSFNFKKIYILDMFIETKKSQNLLLMFSSWNKKKLYCFE